VLSFGYTDLNGVYDGAGQFTATAGSVTSGDVTRLDLPTSQTANFDGDFITRSPSSNAVFNIDVTNIRASMDNPGLSIADGAGDFLLTDDDGDTIAGTISGTWMQGPIGFIFFNGDISGVTVSDNGVQDASFDGTDGGSFSTEFDPEPDLGALITLTFSTAGFFDGAFSNVATLIDGEILPTPGTGILFAAAGAAFVRRRR